MNFMSIDSGENCAQTALNI